MAEGSILTNQEREYPANDHIQYFSHGF